MKKTILMFTMLFALVATTFAQTTQTPQATDPIEKKQKGKDKMQHANKDRAADELGLNADQKAKMKEIRTTQQGKMKAIKSDQSLTKEQKKAQMQTAMTEHDNAIKNILTPEQQTKMTAMKEKRKAEMKANKGKNKGKHMQKGVQSKEKESGTLKPSDN